MANLQNVSASISEGCQRANALAQRHLRSFSINVLLLVGLISLSPVGFLAWFIFSLLPLGTAFNHLYLVVDIPRVVLVIFLTALVMELFAPSYLRATRIFIFIVTSFNAVVLIHWLSILDQTSDPAWNALSAVFSHTLLR